MSLRKKPLVRFESSEKATIVDSSMPSSSRRKRRQSSRGKKKRSASRPRVIKGRLNLRVAGFPGVQKFTATSLIPFLPLNKLRTAAGKVLKASGKKKTTGGGRRKRRAGGRTKKRTSSRRKS
jgi:hypothetical protein